VNIRDNPIYAAAGQPKANQSGVVAPIATRVYNRFYVGDNNGPEHRLRARAAPLRRLSVQLVRSGEQSLGHDTGTLAEGAIRKARAARLPRRT
jgi:hypothetical protein